MYAPFVEQEGYLEIKKGAYYLLINKNLTTKEISKIEAWAINKVLEETKKLATIGVVTSSK